MHDQGRWPALHAKLEDRFATRTRTEWEELFDGSDACVTPVLSLAESLDAPQLAARPAAATWLSRSAPARRADQRRSQASTPRRSSRSWASRGPAASCASGVPVVDGAHFPAGAAVVVGGSGGIGRAICVRLAEHGSDVALTYRANSKAAHAAAEDVQAAGREAFAGRVDLVDEPGVERFFADVADRFGAVHTVIYAIGADIPMVHATQIEAADWRRTIDGDLTGFFHVVRAAIPYLRTTGGSLVAISSAGLVRHPPSDILSTVPKAGIEALVRGIAREEGRYGVRANAVALGVVEAGHFHRVAAELRPEFVEAMRNNTAIRRLGTAREAADAVVFLASSASSYTTGCSLTVDGGYSV